MVKIRSERIFIAPSKYTRHQLFPILGTNINLYVCVCVGGCAVRNRA